MVASDDNLNVAPPSVANNSWHASSALFASFKTVMIVLSLPDTASVTVSVVANVLSGVSAPATQPNTMTNVGPQLKCTGNSKKIAAVFNAPASL